MNDRASLLGQLRIDRDDAPERPGRGRIAWAVAAAFAVAAVAAGGWLGVERPWDRIPVGVAMAEPAPSDAPVQRGSVLDASGYVVARRQATVSSKITGRVVEVSIEEGQRVKAGQVIARLDDANARAAVALAKARRAEAKASLDAALVALKNARPTFARDERQYELKVISAESFDTAKAAFDAARSSADVAAQALGVADADLAVAQRDLDDTIVRAPFAGVVTVKAAQEGEMVSPVSAGGGFTRTGIGTIVDMSSLEVQVDVSESFIHRVRAGQAVTIQLNAYPDWTIPGHVIAVIPTADRAKATVPVRVAFASKDARILPEMGVRVSFLTDSRPSASAAPARAAVVVPTDAVQSDGDTGVVYVIRRDKVERRAVRLGARTDAGQLVLAGLPSGTRLAVGHLSELADGVRIRIEE